MNKNISLWIILFLLFPCLSWSGGVDNKENFSATYVGSASRNGAIKGMDITAYNPAGIVYLKNGLSAASHIQFISTNYDHEINGNEYSAENYPILPTLFAVYKKNKWAGYLTFTGVGGGGQVEYSKGNIITQKLSAGIKAILLPLNTSISNQYAYVESFDYALTTGVSYAVSDKLSFSAGIRYVIIEKTARLRGTINSDYGKQPIIATYEQDGNSIGGVFGVNYRFSETLNFGMRYATKVNLDWETSIPAESYKTYGPLPISGAALLSKYNRNNKTRYPRDLPAVLGLGIAWNITDTIELLPSATFYFERSANWGEQNYSIDYNAMDLALAIKYQLNPKINLSCGYMYTNIGVNPNNFGIIEQMSPPLDGHSIGLGMEYKFTDKLTMCIGSMINFYEPNLSETTYLAPGMVLASETTYKKRNYIMSMGFEYSFF